MRDASGIELMSLLEEPTRFEARTWRSARIAYVVAASLYL